MNDREDLLVKVATAANEPLARMWAETLDREGILCLVKPVTGPGTAGVWAAGIIEHEIWVRGSQAERAAAILSEMAGSDDDLIIERQPEKD